MDYQGQVIALAVWFIWSKYYDSTYYFHFETNQNPNFTFVSLTVHYQGL